MNIFVLDNNIKLCAKYHCDKHVNKMLLEMCQMLCSAHYEWQTNNIPYRKAYFNHPCTKWIRTSNENYYWGLELGFELSNEYTYRYGKIHKCLNILNWCKNNNPKAISNERTPWALAMPDQYKCNNAITSYRNYYVGEKAICLSGKIGVCHLGF